MLTVTTTGRLTADLEVKTSQKGNGYLRFNLAVNKGFGESAKAIYLQCWLYGEQVDRMVKAGVKKGSLIEIAGDLDIVEFEKKDGTKATVPKVTLYSWAYAPSNKAKGDDGGNSAGTEAPPSDQGFYAGETTVDDEDLPF